VDGKSLKLKNHEVAKLGVDGSHLQS
jgi:hypothetical protein